MRALLIIWYRDLLRFLRNRLRIVSSLLQPLFWLLLFGTGISGSLRFSGGQGTLGNFNYTEFLFPGVLGMTVLFTSLFSAISVVRDREFGFLKAILVAPVSRVYLGLGKILGGATVSTIQGFLILVLLPLVGVKLRLNFIILFPLVFLVAVMISALGLLISAQIKTTEGFQMIMQFITFPMFMLSGALFPLTNLPLWMDILSKINPATYGIDLLRQTTFRLLGLPDAVRQAFAITLFGKPVSIMTDILIIFVFGTIVTIIAAKIFARQEK